MAQESAARQHRPESSERPDLRGYMILIDTEESLDEVRAAVERSLQIELGHAHPGMGVFSVIATMLGFVATTPEGLFLLARNPFRKTQKLELDAYPYALLMLPRSDDEVHARDVLTSLGSLGWSMALFTGLAQRVAEFRPDVRPG